MGVENNMFNATQPQKCHYADPFKQACQPDELKANITAKPTDLEICVSKCKTDADCPTDTCPECTRQAAQHRGGSTRPYKCSSDKHMEGRRQEGDEGGRGGGDSQGA